MTERTAASTGSLGLVPLRAAVGLVFLLHGSQKVFAYGFAGTAGAMEHMGIPAPGLAAAVVMTVEFLGGIAILAGLFTRLAAGLLAIDMAVAILAVKLPGGFLGPRGFEFEFTLLCGALTLAALGAGGASLDQILRRRRAGA